MVVPPAPVWVPSKSPLAPGVASVASDKGDNEMILGAVNRSPGICLRAEKNPRKPQIGDEGADQLVIALNGVPFLQLGTVGSHSMSGSEKEGALEPWAAAKKL